MYSACRHGSHLLAPASFLSKPLNLLTQTGSEAALAAAAPSPLRITMPAACYAGTQQEAFPAGDPGGAPVELWIKNHRFCTMVAVVQ